jgi:hypothetical protein
MRAPKALTVVASEAKKPDPVEIPDPALQIRHLLLERDEHRRIFGIERLALLGREVCRQPCDRSHMLVAHFFCLAVETQRDRTSLH